MNLTPTFFSNCPSNPVFRYSGPTTCVSPYVCTYSSDYVCAIILWCSRLILTLSRSKVQPMLVMRTGSSESCKFIIGSCICSSTVAHNLKLQYVVEYKFTASRMKSSFRLHEFIAAIWEERCDSVDSYSANLPSDRMNQQISVVVKLIR